MKNIIMLGVIASFIISAFLIIPEAAEAKGSSYYKSASSGRFVTKSYSTSNKSTTYKSHFR